ncbi:MAG TPA: VCBS domain-containing protein, partial [Pseudomonadales bacterium]|nr:VCBS domain-containing protein [Pseudomonadales bacterium]
LAEGETLILTYSITATDSSDGLIDVETVTITITGSNDVPVISLANSDKDSAAFNENNAALQETGTLGLVDIDTRDVVEVSVFDVVAEGDTTGLLADQSTLQAMLTFAETNVIGTSSTSGVITWQFNSGTEAFDYLAVGERLTLTYTVRATDSQGATDDHNVVFVIDGSNDQPELTVAAAETFVEMADASAQVLTQQGTVTFQDADVSDTVSLSFISDQNILWSGGVLESSLAEKLVAGFELQGENLPATGEVDWTYQLDAEDFDFLAVGETISFSYTVSLLESQGAALSQTIAFTLVGTNDAPVLRPVSAMTFTDTAANDDFNDVSGSLEATDLDRNDTRTFAAVDQYDSAVRSGFDKAVDGSYGTLYLNSQTGAYVFAPDNQAINALTDNTEERFTFSVSDDSESVDQTLVINLVAANDTPDIIASVASTSYVETAADDNFIVTTGSLTGSDRDDNATAEYGIEGGSSDSSRDGFDQSLRGRFGTLYLNSVSGLYAYVPNDAEIEGLSEGDRELETFVLSRSDGSANATTRFDVWVTGAADQPIITEAGDSVELIETNSGLSSSGTFTVVDNDLND